MVFLEFFKPLVVELLFVSIVLGEELVEGAFAIGWKDFACDARHGLVAARNKTCGVGFGMMTLGWRQRVELVEHTHTRQEICNRIIRPCHPLRYGPTSTCKAKILVK